MIISDKAQKMRGAIHLEVRRKGNLIRTDDDHNLIVAAGRAKLARLLGGGSSAHISKIGVGTGTVTEADSDTALTDAVFVPLTSTEYDGSKAKFNFTIGTGDANGLAITELGLFFDDDTIFSRRVRKSVISKEDDIEISGYWEIYL